MAKKAAKKANKKFNFTVSFAIYPNYPETNTIRTGFIKITAATHKEAENKFKQLRGFGRSDCRNDGERFRVTKGNEITAVAN